MPTTKIIYGKYFLFLYFYCYVYHCNNIIAISTMSSKYTKI